MQFGYKDTLFFANNQKNHRLLPNFYYFCAMKRQNHLFSAQQWIGIALLLAIIVVLSLVVILLSHRAPKQPIADELQVLQTEAQTIEQELQREQQIRRHAYQRDTIRVVLHEFDPNTADSSTLVHLGLRPWMAHNILRYREAGGVFRSAEALRRVYGMSDSLFLTLEPYVRIDSTRFALPDTIPSFVSTKRDTILSLNACDTTELMMIRGIGAYTARQIVRYRRQLGGFVAVKQLLEVKGFRSERFDSIAPHFFVELDSVHPIPVNTASIRRLARHPYICYEQAEAIYTLRRKKGHLSSLDDLQSLPQFADSTINRLTPYLSFE